MTASEMFLNYRRPTSRMEKRPTIRRAVSGPTRIAPASPRAAMRAAPRSLTAQQQDLEDSEIVRLGIHNEDLRLGRDHERFSSINPTWEACCEGVVCVHAGLVEAGGTRTAYHLQDGGYSQWYHPSVQL